jgi:hypothetical protein
MVNLVLSSIHFFPNVSPGYKIVENPVNLVFLPVNTHSIDKVTVRLTDQDGKFEPTRRDYYYQTAYS